LSLEEIPAFGFGRAINAIIPVAARRCFAPRGSQAIVCRGLGGLRLGSLRPQIRYGCETGPRQHSGEESRNEFRGTV
jgi:hypothetical protein